MAADSKYPFTNTNTAPSAVQRSALPGIRKTALRRTWWQDAREVLGLSQEEMAEAVGLSRTHYQRVERGEIDARTTQYFTVCAMLEERGIDSRGRILAAKAVGL